LTVAVKEIIHSAKDEQVQDELALIIKVRHPNLVLFMGVAQPSLDKLCLVSEYMGKGNLYTVLHDKALKLDWKKRIGIALDAARAMNYLHCSKPAIVHKTLNSINILVRKTHASN
jgi:serine/threonine protein kinase